MTDRLAWRTRFRFNVGERQGIDTLLAAYAAGVRYFDTAPDYGYGRGGHVFGQALRTLDRDSLVLLRKVGRWMSPNGDNEEVAGWRTAACPSSPPSTTAARAHHAPSSNPYCASA
jgi:aryl-alcohol dehydrogenase-like predicted oxidoreductase